MIVVRNAGKRYADATALTDVSFQLSAGASVALLGPNGSGKTTLLNLLAGRAKPDRGEIEIDGRAPRRGSGTAFVAREPALYDRLTARETLDYFCRLGGGSATRVWELASELGIEALLPRRCSTLSTGQRHLVDLARVLVASPRALLLDEPLWALDDRATARLSEVLRRARRMGMVVMLATQDRDDARRVCDHALVLEHGRLIYDGVLEGGDA